MVSHARRLRTGPRRAKRAAPKVMQPVLADYKPEYEGLRRLRGCLVGIFSVGDESRFQVLQSDEALRRMNAQYESLIFKDNSRSMVCGPHIEAYRKYGDKVEIDGTYGDKWLVASSLRRRTKIQGWFVPLHEDPRGTFSESLGIVLACQSAKGAIVGHLEFSVQIGRETHKSEASFLVTFYSIHVLQRWRHRGYGNDMVVAAALIAEDCLVSAFRAMPPKTDMHVYFIAETDVVAGYQCAMHFNDYLEYQMMSKLREGIYGIDISGCQLSYDENID